MRSAPSPNFEPIGSLMKIATWNVNSIRARLDHVTHWLEVHQPDVLLMQELKGTEFPAEAFAPLGYQAEAVTQKAYNGVAILSRHPIEVVAIALPGDEADGHARYLEVNTNNTRIVNIYLPNGNPVGSPNFGYKLASAMYLLEVLMNISCRAVSEAIADATAQHIEKH